MLCHLSKGSIKFFITSATNSIWQLCISCITGRLCSLLHITCSNITRLSSKELSSASHAYSLHAHTYAEVWTQVTQLGPESDSSNESDDFRLDLTKSRKTCNLTLTLTPMAFCFVKGSPWLVRTQNTMFWTWPWLGSCWSLLGTCLDLTLWTSWSWRWTWFGTCLFWFGTCFPWLWISFACQTY